MAPSSAGDTLEEIVLRLENRKLEREIALSEAIEERKIAYELAKSREMLYWSMPGGFLTMLASAYSSFHHRNVIHTLPVLPIMTYLCYQAHLCYGNKMNIIRKSAEALLAERTCPILRPITLEDVRRRREELAKNRDSEW
uniref:Plasminogen receptor (KT) n=1 Tax=Ascaris lumbricoides TaxID=6252 RepID=A0A0M3HRF3_ASCLU